MENFLFRVISRLSDDRDFLYCMVTALAVTFQRGTITGKQFTVPGLLGRFLDFCTCCFRLSYEFTDHTCRIFQASYGGKDIAVVVIQPVDIDVPPGKDLHVTNQPFTGHQLAAIGQ